jgi:hypothetical protein
MRLMINHAQINVGETRSGETVPESNFLAMSTQSEHVTICELISRRIENGFESTRGHKWQCSVGNLRHKQTQLAGSALSFYHHLVPAILKRKYRNVSL